MLPHEEGPLEVDAGQLCGPDGDAGGAVHPLADLLAVVLELPLRLRLAPRVRPHGDGLHGPEVGPFDAGILRTRVEFVGDSVAVKISETDVADAVLVGVRLVGVGQQRAVVGAVGDAVAVRVVITVVAFAVVVDVQLVGIVVVRAVVGQVGDTVQVAVITVVAGVTCNDIEIFEEKALNNKFLCRKFWILSLV